MNDIAIRSGFLSEIYEDIFRTKPTDEKCYLFHDTHILVPFPLTYIYLLIFPFTCRCIAKLYTMSCAERDEKEKKPIELMCLAM